MTKDSHANYVDTYFEYKSLTKIHGEPTYESLKKLKDELKANAASVNSDLGGGLYGHLDLILQEDEYHAISAIPYQRPEHPGELNIPLGTPQHESTRLRNFVGGEWVRVFCGESLVVCEFLWSCLTSGGLCV